MARIKAAVLVYVAVILLLSTCAPISYCAKKPVAGARKEDVPYITCQISEFEIIGIAENVCNLKKEEADWILKIDIVEQGDKLVLVEQEAEGQCNSECKTIERACQEIMGYSDTDVAEYLYTSKPDIKSLVNYLCKDLSKACSTKPPPVLKNRIPGEPFVPKPAKEAEMERIMRSMEGMPGAPGMQMYSKEDLMNMKNFGGEDGDDNDDEDDDDESDFPKNLGKVFREKESKSGDWKQRITDGILNTGDVLKKQANKVSNHVQRWWSGIKAARSKKPGKTEL
ncbi:Saposin B-type domain-containing protein [Citrus sinensis]|uniref:Saposin B-type domain-containing protein n=1 Tax=Citrus sinensis TaxID=2711 RepID=A0ACB8NT92_CITSI|nr:Saposin B-type domain-containing protein [Citrus sinensis]